MPSLFSDSEDAVSPPTAAWTALGLASLWETSLAQPWALPLLAITFPWGGV